MPIPFFQGEVQTQWLKEPGEDRNMRLLAPFAFADSHGNVWHAHPGDEINGASIPAFLWSLVGSPYTGDYRRASVLHDVACRKRTRPSKEVHRMFFEAMLSDGVPKHMALQFYTAVRLFGPNWSIDADGITRTYSSEATVRPDIGIDEVEAVLDAVLRS